MRSVKTKFDFNALSPLSKVALCSLFFVVALAVFVPIFSPFSGAGVDLSVSKLPPNSTFIFGTDFLGRDLLTRCCEGLRVSLFVGLLGGSLTLFLGVIFAVFASLFAREFWLGLFEILLSTPSLLIALFVQSLFGGGLILAIFVISLMHFAFVAKVVEAEFYALKKSDFYQHCVVCGYSKPRLLLTQLLPNAAPLLLTLFVLNFAHAITTEATLSFFGLGVGLGEASLGTLLSEGANAIFIGGWWLVVLPVVVFLLLLMPLLHFANDAKFKAAR